MSGAWGNCIQLSIFGESHGPAIGMILNGLAAGIELDHDLIRNELDRRAPGKNGISTPRQERDDYEMVSGYFQGCTTGAPLCCLIHNRDVKSAGYEDTKDIMRPGHADFTARLKYAGFNDYRGGGHFSGRLTAPLVLAGAIARQLLKAKGITLGSHILAIGNVREERFDPVQINAEQLTALRDKEFAVLNDEAGNDMKQHILMLKEKQDSVGGVVETAIVGLPIGIGSPFFDSVESKIAHLLFSIPAVKALEFGTGFELAQMRGSEANDEFTVTAGRVQTETNHCGGILGGITNGMPVIFRAAFKPTPSIGKPQKTVDMAEMENVDIRIKGRHDPCIVPRAVPAVEAAAALALLDLMIEKEGSAWMTNITD